YAATDTSGENSIDQPLGQSPSACLFSDADLPDKVRIRMLGRDIARQPTHDLAIDLGDRTGRSEMAALKQIAVHRIVVERSRVSHELPYGSAVFSLGTANRDCRQRRRGFGFARSGEFHLYPPFSV